MIDRICSFLDRLSYSWLAPLAILVGMAPWPAGPQPHLFEKLGMLAAGQLTRPLDIFDLFFHGSALLLLLAKAAADLLRRRTGRPE